MGSTQFGNFHVSSLQCSPWIPGIFEILECTPRSSLGSLTFTLGYDRTFVAIRHCQSAMYVNDLLSQFFPISNLTVSSLVTALQTRRTPQRVRWMRAPRH